MRIAAGSLVVLGAVLWGVRSSGFLALSAFVGAGLVFAGITDTCGMGMLLARMPWNQVKDDPAPVASRRRRSAHETAHRRWRGRRRIGSRPARRLSEDAHIVLFERGPDVSFANCGLPYYLGGEIAERDKLLVVTPERLRTRFNLDVRVRTSVEAIDRAAKKVRVRDLASGREYEEAYDKLILARGRHRSAAAARHRPARHLHAAEPARRGPHQGPGGPRREAGGRGGGGAASDSNWSRTSCVKASRPQWSIAGPSVAAFRQGDGDSYRGTLGKQRRLAAARSIRRGVASGERMT